MDISKVRELVKLVEDSGIEELEVTNLDTTIRIQKSPTYLQGAATMAAAPIQVAAQLEAPVSAVPSAVEATPAQNIQNTKWKDVR